MKYSILSNRNRFNYIDNIQYLDTHSILFNTFSITSITFIYLISYEFFETINFRFIYLFYELTYSFIRIFTRNLFTYHSIRMTTRISIFANFVFFIFESILDIFFDHFFYAFVSTQMIRKRKIFEFYITNTRNYVLLIFRNAIDSFKQRKHKKIIIYESMN